MGAQREDVAGHRLGRPVFVHRTDERVVRVEEHPVVAELGDGAAAGERGHASASAARHRVVLGVVVQPPRPHSPSGQHPVGGELDTLVELGASDRLKRSGCGHQREELVEVPLVGGHFGDKLLDQDVERCDGRDDGIEAPAVDGGEERTTLDQVVAGLREQPTLRYSVAIVVGSTDSLEERGDVPGRTELADEVDRPNVNAEFERRCGHEGLEVAGAQPSFDLGPPFFRERPVVSNHVGLGEVLGDRGVGRLSLCQAFAKLVADALGHAASVDEHEGGGVGFDEVGDVLEDLAHLLCWGNRLHFRRRDDQVEVELADMAFIDDGAVEVAVVSAPGTNQKVGHRRDGFLGCRQPNAHRASVCPTAGATQVVEAFEGERQVRAAFVSSERMDLIDDDRVDGTECRPGSRRRAHEVQRLGGGHDKGRWLLDHGGSYRGRRVARAHADADGRCRPAHRLRDCGDLHEGSLEVLGNVDGQGLQR